MGYQPGLDGLRAISVAAVIVYHGGFGWLHGGFLGVEVFFVVSGFLITSLLIEERERTRTISLGNFWMRRARRLFPALFAMLLAVATWTALFGTAQQTTRMKRDLPWSVFYAANWGQIVGDVPYFAAGDPPLLRHLWSLAVEEQWYVVWPLVFVVLTRTGWSRVRIAKVLLGGVVAVMALMWWVQRGAPEPMQGAFGWLDGADRTNVNYLSTVTRSGGLLLGAAAAFVWRPWRSVAARRVPSRPLDLTMGVVLGMLVCCFVAAELTAGYMYPWLLTTVSLLSLVAVAVVVHPAATGSRWLLSRPALVEVGKRSYGLYLWHWPVFVFAGATGGSVPRFVAALVVSVAIAEVSYRYVETPIRNGALGRWWHSVDWSDRRQMMPTAGVGALAFCLVVFYVSVEPHDVAAGGESATFDLTEFDLTEAPSTADTPVVAQMAVAPTTIADDPARTMAIVGDSQAHSLAVNQPAGLSEVFDIENWSLDGCSVYDSGRVYSSHEGFTNTFARCEGWVDHWADAATGKELALVVLGAWDVFDVETAGTRFTFGTLEFDAMFTARLGEGVDAMAATGAQVAILEAACMRPVSAEGAAVPPLPERGDDGRVAHVNGLLRRVAEARPGSVTFVGGPDAWCTDEAIATDIGYRWDGVHVYEPGAELIYETIASTLLAL